MQDGTQSPNIGSDGFVTIPDVSVDAIANRVLPRQTTSGDSRGTTQRVVNTDGSYVTFGLIPDGGTDLGVAYFDANGNLISKDTGSTRTTYDSSNKKILVSGLLDTGEYGQAFYNDNGILISKNVGATEYVYDANTGKNIIQIGLLPDGTYGFVVANTGFNVSDGFA